MPTSRPGPPAAWWPRAVRRPLTLDDGARGRVPAEALAGAFTASPVGWILHVTCMRGSPWRVFHDSRSPDRRFCHLWIAREGVAEQYAPLTHKSWAQGDGNGAWWSVETDGQPGEPLTGAQLDTLAAWHVWCGAPDVLADSPTGRGIGTHYMGGKAWGGHSCPDPAPGGKGPRSRQRADIIARARALRASTVEDAVSATQAQPQAVDLTVGAIREIARTVADAVASINAVYPVVDPLGPRELPDGRHVTAPPVALEEILATVRALREDVEALRASVGR